jgi:hypothetical protein
MKNTYNPQDNLTPEKMLENLIDSLVEDVLNATDEELLEHLVEAGENPEEVARRIRPFIDAALHEVDSESKTQSSKTDSPLEEIPLITRMAASDGRSERSSKDFSLIGSEKLEERFALIGEKDIQGNLVRFYEGPQDTVFIEFYLCASPSVLMIGGKRYRLEKVKGELAIHHVSGLSAINTIGIFYEDFPETDIGIEFLS